MEKICTTIDQSKKLIELGIDVNTADMLYPYDRHLDKFYGDIAYVMGYKRFNENTDFPAWSVSALMGLIPYNITENSAVYRFTVEKYLNKWKCFHVNWGMVSTSIISGETLLDTVFEMVCWLKENNKI